MPVRKSGEAHRALELLEEYHAELSRPSDTELKNAIEKVISIFKSNLFQALCDIQDFYDNTLLNERVPLTQKTVETRRLAERWEAHPPFGGVPQSSHNQSYDRGTFPSTVPYTNGTESRSSRYEFKEERQERTQDGWFTSERKTHTVDGPAGYFTETTAV
jgi:hypothetical protein